MIAKELRLLLGVIAIACAALAGGQACAQGVTKTRILIGHSGPLSAANAVTLAQEEGVLALFGYASATPSVPALPTVEKDNRNEYFCTSLEAYIGATILVEAIRRAGPDLNRESLLKALDAMHNVDAGGYTIDFSPSNHNGSKFVDLAAISAQGRFSY